MEDRKLKHIAIIMDGNGRWAQSRGHKRVWGHIRGSSIVSDIVEEADNLGIKSLTLYAFSSENWSRPFLEVKVLFTLLKKFLLRERKRIISNNIRFRVIGDTSELPKTTLELIKNLELETSNADGLNLSFAFGYGGRSEITRSVNTFIKKYPGREISEQDIYDGLYLNKSEDVDLLIRTGGDYRVSNFLLWQIAYSEMMFTETKWPDFSREEFRSIVKSVSKRERRFGSISNDITLNESVEIASKNKKELDSNLRVQ